MPTDVLMPQMGESIAEGTIVRWIKRVGDPVDRDEPLFEISTDKVDAEVPAPVGGVLVRIRAEAGETVPVNSVVAVIGASAEAGAETGGGADRQTGAGRGADRQTGAGGGADRQTGAGRGADRQTGAGGEAAAPPAGPAAPGEAPAAAVGVAAPSPPGTPAPAPAPDAPAAGAPRARLSPVVRRLATEHGVDLSAVAGTGDGGRITKADVLAHVAARGQGAAAVAGDARRPATARGQEGGAVAGDARRPVAARGQEGGTVADAARPAAPAATGARVEPMSVMRRRIAEHMVESRRTSAHVHTLFEVDFSAVAAARAAFPGGAAPGYLAYIAKAAAEALVAMPVVNASVDGTNVVYHEQINLGIAVALEGGLIVPVVKHADRLDAGAIDKTVKDLAARARTKQLAPADVEGGTFTITNPGGFGSLLGMPIINQPQVAILGVGAVEPRPAVIDGAVVARLRAFLTLGFDHRLIDGAVADRFLARIKAALEDPQWIEAAGRP